jgi:hypothetical protein
MSMSMFLGLGAEAFEDQPEVPVVETPAVVAAPVSEEVIELIASRDDAVLANEAATAGAEIAANVRQIDQYADAIERVENVQASMEYFIENGISAKASAMLHSQIGTLYQTLGKDAGGVGSGLENFDNEDASIAILSAGLLALNSEKASLGERIWSALIESDKSITRFLSKFVTRAGRLKARAEKIGAAARQKTGSAEVTMNNKYLVVKGGAGSSNLKADLDAFHKFAEAGSARYFKDAGAFANGASLNLIKEIAAASTMDQTAKAVNKVAYPGYPGATITVQDKDAFVIKRTDVVLGGYAIFDLQYKTTGGNSKAELVHKLKALGKNRVHVKKAPEEGRNGEFKATITAADAAEICDQVVKLASIAGVLQKNITWLDPFTKKIQNDYRAAKARISSNNEAEPGVATVLDYAARTPTSILQSVQSLTWELSTAIFNVADASLKVANKVAKTSEGSSDDESGNNGDAE